MQSRHDRQDGEDPLKRTLISTASLLVALLLFALGLVPFLQQGLIRAELLRCRTNVKNLGSALTTYGQNHLSEGKAQYPGSLSELETDLGHPLPQCPVGGPYRISFEEPGEEFVVCCSHSAMHRLPQGYPRFSTSGPEPGPQPLDGPVDRTCYGLLMAAGLCFYLLQLPAVREDIPVPASVQRSLEGRLWLRYLDALGWCALGVLCTTAVWFATMSWPSLLPRFLASAIGGSYLARLLARLGWTLWDALLPSAHPCVGKGELHEAPFLTGGLRAPVVPFIAQRARAMFLGRIMPGVGLATAFLAPLLFAELEHSWQAAGGVFVAVALLVYPLCCPWEIWQTGLFREELEWVPGTGLLLLHSRPGGRPQVKVLGNRSDLREVLVVDGLASLTLPERTIRIPAGNLSEGLCQGPETRRGPSRGAQRH